MNSFNYDFDGRLSGGSSLNLENDLNVFNFFKHVLNLAGEKSLIDLKNKQIEETLGKLTPEILAYNLQVSLMPFLRCSSLFFSNLTNLTPSFGNINKELNSLSKNFDGLLKFLGIDHNIGQVLDISSNALKVLTDSWISTISASGDFKNKLNILDYPVKPNEFIELPNDYVDLISMSMSSHVCSLRSSSLVDTSSESATILCLICGEMLCSQAYCCQQEIFKKRVGCCTAHAFKCSGTVGVFLRVSECQVLLLHLNMISQEDMQVRGCFVAAPYLDDYGETDQGLRRGNPLRLCKIRYEKLYKDWLSHAIPEEVSRSFQNQTNMLNINWVEL